MNVYRIPTLKRVISIDDEGEGTWRVIDKEGFFVYGDSLKEKTEQHLRDYGKRSIESGVMFVSDTNAQNALRLFFSHEGAKTGLNGKGSTRALRINDTVPIIELPGCQLLDSKLPRIAQNVHDGLCQIMGSTALRACAVERALTVIERLEKHEWNSFCIQLVSIGTRASDAYPFISAQALLDHPLFDEQTRKEKQRAFT